MRNSITSDQLVLELFLQENSSKQNTISNSVINSEARITELENELKKQKAAAEKGAKLMQTIWGDKFQSDSLH